MSSENRSSLPKSRRFHAFSNEVETTCTTASPSALEWLRNDLIGGPDDKKAVFRSPFGPRRIVYADHVASNKALFSVEHFILTEVQPYYSNTHTSSTYTSKQTSMYREEARLILRNALNAAENDAVLLVGTGATGAVHKLADLIRRRFAAKEIVVVVGPMEHHANLLPWRHVAQRVVNAPLNAEGMVDIKALDTLLGSLKSASTTLVGCFTSSSNITGLMSDDLLITATLHLHGALAIFDYAASASHTAINMNPKMALDKHDLLAKDALFFSGHKVLGGPQTPGVLVLKKRFFDNIDEPELGGGGGAVFFVTEVDQRYLRDAEMREEGGTPPIIETIRLALALRIKESIGVDAIRKREYKLFSKLIKKIEPCMKSRKLIVLGPLDKPRLPTLSFVIRPFPQTSKLLLHHNFVVALLNDLFGIQSRGGCMCAGPYAQTLLGIDLATAKEFEKILVEDDRLDRDHLRRQHEEHGSYEMLRPGFVRLSLSCISTEEEAAFIGNSLKFVCEHGHEFLPMYKMNNETGEFKYAGHNENKDRKWISNLGFLPNFNDDSSDSNSRSGGDNENPDSDYVNCGIFRFRDKYRMNPLKPDELSFDATLEMSHQMLIKARKDVARASMVDHESLFNEDAKRLRWFILPSEAIDLMLNGDNTKLKENIVFSLPELEFEGLWSTEEQVGSLGCVIKGSKELEAILNACGERELKYLYDMDTKESKKDTKQTTEEKKEKYNEGECEQKEGKKTTNNSKALICTSDLCQPRSKTESISSSKVQHSSIRTIRPRQLWRAPSKSIFKPFLEAMSDFTMIKNGDRVLVCLSGGKDSLSLLHTMRQYKLYLYNTHGISFELGAITVDPQSSGYDPRPLVPYLEQLGCEYLFESQNIMEQALAAECSSFCAFCSRLKRGRLYAAARRRGYNVLAMGQHLDDLAESLLMSIFHNGRLRTLKANYWVRERDLRIIRPFVYVREKMLRQFAAKEHLPVIAENCPACFEEPKERHRTKQLLAQQELLFPRLYASLRSAMKPLMGIDRTGVEKKIFGTNGFGFRENFENSLQ